jgi:RNA polymerase sigma-70 factor (ECF subfamily)
MGQLLRSEAPLLYTLQDQSLDRGRVEEHQRALDQFLAEVERPAYRTAEVSTRNPDDALDIVQDTMIKWVEKYSSKPRDEWRPLFYAILHSRITDYHRKSTLTRRLFGFFEMDDDLGELPSMTSDEGPLELLTKELTLDRLLVALEALSPRQQQVFMLRTWQGFSVAETASVLKCSEGSVKTHLSRATETLMKSIDRPGEDHE